MSVDQKPVPELTELNRPFFEAAATGRLSIQRCTVDGHRWFPPSRRCPQCLSTEVEWVAVSGRGTLWSWIRMHQKYFSGFADDLPYEVGFIQLEEGPFMMARIVGATPAELTCDAAMTALFETAWNGTVFPVFTPAVAS